MSNIHQGRKIVSEGDFTVLDCEVCGFKHLNPIPGQKELNDFYAKHYYQSHKPAYIQQDELDRQYLEISYDERIDIFERLTKGRMMLDIGCGAGMFLAYAAGRGWHCQGVEPSASAAEVARSKGLHVFHGAFEEFFAADKRIFDVIYLKNVLEHVPDPLTLLETCCRRLSDEGMLFVEVPNDFEWMQKLGVMLHKEKRSWISVPDHINYFDYKSLAKLLRRFGLKPVKRSTTFPIYGCLLLGQNFIADRQAGIRAHQARVSFELFCERYRLRWLKQLMYTFLACIGTGRTIIYYCNVNNKELSK